uniref:Replication protein A 70 kDa DNA-binding subunit B/D first OB fold domain-containing protein n=1 Tax=Lactuca sativa TaxID=4236 RepID=A0A9R1XIF2_LACSA|nr:hypothetical protein LSAT_V11C400175370 [Lactuca sativa]
MFGIMELILIDQQGTKIYTTIKKNFIHVFEAIFNEGVVTEIIHVSTDIVDKIFLGKLCHRISCESLLRMQMTKVLHLNLTLTFENIKMILPRLSFFYIWLNSKLGVPQVGNCLFGSRLHINDDIPHILESKERLVLFLLSRLFKKVAKNDDDSVAEHFNCDGCGGVSEVYGKIKVVVRVQDESGSSSFLSFGHHDQGLQNIPVEVKTLLNRKFVFKVQISMFNLEKNYLAYIVHKLIDDESILAKVFKRSPTYEQQEKFDLVHGDNLEVVDLEAVTLSSSVDKRLIDIVATTDSLERSFKSLYSSYYPEDP